MSNYEDEPYVEFERADGSILRAYKSKTDPFASRITIDDKVLDMTEVLQEAMDSGNFE